MSLAEIEQAIAGLPAEDFSRFAQWFEAYAADKWDGQIEQDAAAGKFDAVIREVDKEIADGRATLPVNHYGASA